MNFKTQLILAALFLAAGCPEAPLDTTTKDSDIPTVDGDADTDADADADSDADADTDETGTHTGG